MTIESAVAEKIARVCHEVNRAYCLAFGDNTQVPWEQAPAWQRESAVAGVMFHVEHPEAGPEASHESWLKQKIEDGWKWGHVKDPANKLHPSIRPFDHLPQQEQAKDYLFRAVVHAMVAP